MYFIKNIYILEIRPIYNIYIYIYIYIIIIIIIIVSVNIIL